jgi:hypothetical protein
LRSLFVLAKACLFLLVTMFNRSFLRRRKVSKLPQSFVQYSSGASDDQFGYSCALSSDGTTAIVGQPYDDNAKGTNAGSAVVFIRSGTTWTEQAVLTYSAGAANDTLGFSVDLSSDGNTAICGVPSDNPSGSSSGSAVVFTRSGVTWTQQAVLTYSSGASSDLFGYSVALSGDGNTAICGALLDDPSGSNSGSAIVFTRSGVTWTEQATLTHSVGAAGANFGTSVDLSSNGNTAIVGAPNDSLLGSTRGSAVVFIRSGVTWTEQATLRYSAATNGDSLGVSVALSSDGNTAIAGAPYADPGGLASAGVVVVFTRSGATWKEQSALTYSGKDYNDKFGYSVSLSGNGDVVISGTPGTPGTNAGAAVMFARNNGLWNQQSALSYLSGSSGDYLGWSVALSTDSNVAIAGAPGVGLDVGGAAIFYNH